MPERGKQKSARPARRRGGRAPTRERLLAAALELLHRGGESAVTTVSLTREAGITQSAFYRHFANVAECLAAAAERVTGEIRTAVAAHRRAMFASGPGTGADLERAFRAMFALVRRQRPVTQLFLRHRSDPLALNGVMYRFARGLVADLAGQLAGRALKAGLPAPDPVALEALADGLVGASLAAVEAYLDGRGPAVEESARLLAAFSTGASVAVYEALRTTA
jgi:AcrR family transcriptional regulator